MHANSTGPAAALAISFAPTVDVAGEMADAIGPHILQDCATVARLNLQPAGRLLGFRTFRPVADNYAAAVTNLGDVLAGRRPMIRLDAPALCFIQACYNRRGQDAPVPTAVIDVSGGCVQQCHADTAMAVYVLDYDDAPVDDDPGSCIETNDGKAYLGNHSPHIDPAYVRSIEAAPSLADGCRTCAEQIETRAMPCDECGHADEDEAA